MHHGLPRKIRIAFVVQMALASLAILLAFYVVTTLFKYSFIQATLKDEARHYWELHQASPVQPPPNTYTLRGGDRVSIRYQFRDGFNAPEEELDLRARVDEDSGNRRWRTWFYKVVPTHTRVLEVAPDYSWALIGYPGREMAWIFAREPDMDAALYRQLALRLRDRYEVNTDKLKRVPQHPAQVGKLGFEVPNRD